PVLGRTSSVPGPRLRGDTTRSRTCRSRAFGRLWERSSSPCCSATACPGCSPWWDSPSLIPRALSWPAFCRASVPLHLAVNGSLEVGHTVGIVLAGDATELLKEDVRQELEGLGVPPMRDLLAKVREHQVPVYV